MWSKLRRIPIVIKAVIVIIFFWLDIDQQDLLMAAGLALLAIGLSMVDVYLAFVVPGALLFTLAALPLYVSGIRR